MSGMMAQLVIGFALFLAILFWYLVGRNESGKSDKLLMACLFSLVVLGMVLETAPPALSYYFPDFTSSIAYKVISIINRSSVINGLFIAVFIALNLSSSHVEEKLDVSKGNRVSERKQIILTVSLITLTIITLLLSCSILLHHVFYKDQGGILEVSYRAVRIPNDIICLVFFIVCCFTFVKKSQLRERCMFIWFVEFVIFLVRIPLYSTIIYSFGNLLVLGFVLWGHLDLADILNNTPFEKPGQAELEKVLFALYEKRRPFRLIVASFDSRPTLSEQVTAISRFERRLRDLAPFVTHTSKDMFFVPEHNDIVAVIPKKSGGLAGVVSDLLSRLYHKENFEEQVENACNELLNDRSVADRIKPRILIVDPQFENKDAKLGFEVIKRMVRIFSNYDFSPEISRAGIYNLSDSRFNLLRLVVLDMVLDWITDNDKFEVYYQPIFSVTDFEFASVEALVRLPELGDEVVQHISDSILEQLTDKYKERDFNNAEAYAVKQTGKLVKLLNEYIVETNDLKDKTSPAEFVPMIERKKKIHLLGRNVLKQVCDDLSKNRSLYKYVKYIEVNMSRSQCELDNVYEDFDSIIRAHNLARNKFNFELTESIEAESEQTLATIKKFMDNGYNFSLDDFGTGYSNLVKVFDETYSIVKIDKSLLDACLEEGSGKQNSTFFKELLGAISSLGKSIVLEGVSDSERTLKLSRILAEIDNKGAKGYFFQGFYFSEPLQFSDYKDFIREWRDIRGSITSEKHGKVSYNDKEIVLKKFLEEQYANRFLNDRKYKVLKKANEKPIKVLKKALL